MNILLVNEGVENHAFSALSALFKAHHSHVDVISPEDVTSYLDYRRYEAIYMTGQCKNAFSKANKGIAFTPPIFTIPAALHSDEIFSQIAAEYGFENNHIINAAGLKIDLVTDRAYVGSEEISLGTQEYRMMRLLVLHKNNTITIDDLRTALYPDFDEDHEYDNRRTIFGIKFRLAQKIKKAGGNPDVIESIWGQGYLLRDEATELKVISERGPIKIYANNQATYNNTPIEQLTPQEMMVLQTIMANTNRPFDREQQAQLFYPGEANTDGLKKIIGKLREKIKNASKTELSPYGDNIIKTVREAGYQWQNPKPLSKKALDKPKGTIFHWPDHKLQIDTKSKTIVNLATNQNQSLSDRLCLTVEFMHKNHQTTGAELERKLGISGTNIQQLKKKILDVGVPPKKIIGSGKTGGGKNRSKGHSFIMPYTAT